MLTRLKKPLGYINRWRHRKGFGIHSPFAFHLVTSVLGESMPYYAYSRLASFVAAGRTHSHIYTRTYSCKNLFMLFRLVNFRQPRFIVEAGDGPLLCTLAMSMAKPSAACVAIGSMKRPAGRVTSLFLENPNNRVFTGNELKWLHHWLNEGNPLELFHVTSSTHYRELVEAALPYAGAHTLFVIENIHASREKSLWWQQLVESEATGVTFDLGRVGLLFFDKEAYCKLHYQLIF